MGRIRIRKTDRGKIPQDVMEKATSEIVSEGISVRMAAKRYGICHVTLYRFWKKTVNNDSPQVGYKPHNRVFGPEEENILSDYVKHAANSFYGLSTRDLRRLAYQCAVHYNLKFPKNWCDNEMAGVDWLNAFLKRNPSLSIRRPEATSLARTMNFNKPNVNRFFQNLSKVIDENVFEPHNVYNVDETGVTTVQNPSKIIAEKGKKQVGAVTSTERGTLVTVCVAVNATGNCVPPMFVFPRKTFHDYFLRGGPAGCVGAANGSGWMQKEEFLTFMKHFSKHTKPSRENKILLLLDNHESHLYLPTIEFCRENGIVLLSFPPHCSHKLQPLDVSVYGPFKKYVNSAMDAWMKTHPGKRMTIYDIPEIVSTALPRAATPTNIMAGFSATGIWPFNENVFDDSAFAPCEVTESSITHIAHSSVTPGTPVPQPSTSRRGEQETNNVCDEGLSFDVPNSSKFSPEVVRPHAKARNSNENASFKLNNRKKRKTAILTSTPEKAALEEEANRRVPRIAENVRKGKEQVKNRARNKIGLRNRAVTGSSEDEDYSCIVCFDKFNDSRPNEEWVQCVSCSEWAHVRCTKGELRYICQNCKSE